MNIAADFVIFYVKVHFCVPHSQKQTTDVDAEIKE